MVLRYVLAVAVAAGIGLPGSAVCHERAVVCSTLVFDELGECALIPGSEIFNVQEHTVEAWVLLQEHRNQVFVGSQAGDSYWDTFSLWSKNGTLCSSISDGVSNTELLGTGDLLPLQEWLHLAATYDGEYLRTFEFGVQVDSLPWSGVLAPCSASPVTLGIDDDIWPFHAPMLGELGEVRIWSRALSPSELANPVPSSTDSTLVGWWKFEEDEDSQVLLDSSNVPIDGYLGALLEPDDRDPTRGHCETPVLVEPVSWGVIKTMWR